MSIGLMRELTRQGASVPDDVSVIGFDNIFDAALCSPSLTTVAAPLDLLGRAAVETLLAQTSRRSAVAARFRDAARRSRRLRFDRAAWRAPSALDSGVSRVP